MRTLIVSGGHIEDAFALDYIKHHNYDQMIAADRGMEFFYRNGLVPNLIVGDFDSASGEVLQFFRSNNKVEIVTLNPIKDDTDTESAIRRAISDGASHITLLGTTGSRLDHVLGNIQLLGIGLEARDEIAGETENESNVLLEMVDAHNRIRMIKDSLVISKEEQFGNYVSLIPFTPTVTGVTLEGFKYPLTDFTLQSFNSLGVSNEIVGNQAKVTLKEGILLVIEARD